MLVKGEVKEIFVEAYSDTDVQICEKSTSELAWWSYGFKVKIGSVAESFTFVTWHAVWRDSFLRWRFRGE